MEKGLEEVLGPSGKEEVNGIYDRAEELLVSARGKYEDISKLLTGLAAGVLSLSISLAGNSAKESVPFWGKCALLLSWMALIISISYGLYALFQIYRFYRKIFLEHKDIATTGEKVLAQTKPVGRLTFEGLLSEEAKYLRLGETTRMPIAVQFVTFGTGVVLMLVFGILKLWSI
jgi:hypothetical protein